MNPPHAGHFHRLRTLDPKKRSPSPLPSPPGEGEARTVPGNCRAVWCGIASWGLASAPTHSSFVAERVPRMVAPSNGVPGTVTLGIDVTRSSELRRVGGIHAAKAR